MILCQVFLMALSGILCGDLIFKRAYREELVAKKHHRI